MSGDTAYLGIGIRGGLLPAELLSRLSAGKPTAEINGLSSADYGLAAGETVREAANRVWAYLTTVWSSYRKILDDLPPTDRATSLTRERWLLILLDQLGYGRVPTTVAGGITVDGKPFPVSHLTGVVPIHLLGERIELDKRTSGVAGAAGQAPQSMVQELLNRSEAHLWAILSNGSTLRLLRDSTSLVGSAYVEFDLVAIFDGELFSDFLMLYTLCHASRLTVRDVELGPVSCWLELWREAAFEQGSRALDQLRLGVVEALETLGTGFLSHPQNAALRERLESGGLTVSDYNHSLLRVVYRLLFSFVAEDRNALLSPNAEPAARQRYVDYFSTGRLRRTARRRRGGRHGDRWRALQVVWDGLGAPDGLPELGIAGIGGLYEPGELDFLGSASLSNESLLAAVRSLSIVVEKQSGFTRVVDHRNLGAEELGSIYESLLEYVPSWDSAARVYRLGDAAGNARKTTGSYYTPTSLIESLLDTALDPVLDEAEKRGINEGDREAALLAVTVCDPACGSGHFLVGAARRIAKRLAAVRTGDPEPPPEQVRAALRDVVGRCIYGVDINPLAAELAKVSLWLEAMEPGKPLAFLDAQIKVGNALIGVTPALLSGGIPQEAFKPIEGDDRKIVSSLARRNKEEATGQDSLFDTDELHATSNAYLAAKAAGFVQPATSLADIHVQKQRLRNYLDSPEYRQERLHADAWCAAFVWPKTEEAPSAVTNSTLRQLQEKPESLSEDCRVEIERLSAEYRFFHWHLEFPQMFPTDRPSTEATLNPTTGWFGGFSVVLGNPPWERVKLQEQEFFASRDPEIANARNAAARKKLIAQLPSTHPVLHADFVAAKRRAEGESHMLRSSGRFPLAGRGDINTYAVFAEGNRSLVAEHGRLGIILPTGIATDATTQFYFKDLLAQGSLVSLYDFENAKPLFEGVHRSFKFCLLTLAGRATYEASAEFAFFAHDPVDLSRPDVRFSLTPEEITLLNPNTGTCPVFRSRRDAEITLGIYRRVPVLINENDPANGNPWGISFMRMFDMSNDSHLFHTRDELETDGWTLNGNVFEREISSGGGGVIAEKMLPLYEAKMIHHYDHQWATYEPDGSVRDVTSEEKADPNLFVMPHYWVHESEIDRKLDGRWDKRWLLGYRWIARSTDERTFISAILPRVAAGNSLPVAIFAGNRHLLTAVWASMCVDYTARQKLGGANMTFGTMMQLPIPPPGHFESVKLTLDRPLRAWIANRVDRLNAWPVSDDVRATLRSDLDAAMFHVYGVNRDDVDYIMETFPIVKRKDLALHGEYRTKRLILEAYDQLSEGADVATIF